MIGSLTGTVAEVGRDALTLRVGGVGYRVSALPSVLAGVRAGEELTLFTHLHVREDELSLYGFLAPRERAFFELLLEAPGVGPKSALACVSIAGIETLVRAIASGDPTLLTKVSGIGKKTAERIVMELKTKIEREHPDLAERGRTVHADVVDALMSLGYPAMQAREVVRQLPADLGSVEDGILAALKALGQPAVPQRR